MTMAAAYKCIAVIGGGPAGARTAEQLARSGFQVVLFDEKLAWEKPCGGGLPAKALARYPFLAEASDRHRPIEDMEMVAANGAALRLKLREPLVIYSRWVLNDLLLRRAGDAGAEIVRDRILNFQLADGSLIDRREERLRPNGWPTIRWRIQGRNGDYEADHVVLAGGARTRLRGLLAKEFEPKDLMLTFGYFLPGRERLLRIKFFEKFEGYAWAFPRPDHLSIGICGKTGEVPMSAMRERLHGFMREFGYERAEDQGSGLHNSELQDSGCSARSGNPNVQVYSHILPNLSAHSWKTLRLAGPGWALVGDAAGLVDPVTGEGIYFALRSADLLAESLCKGLPAAYPRRVWSDFGRKLALGAHFAPRFYHKNFLGKPSTTQMIELCSRSRIFHGLLQDLLAGTQSYSGLAWRIYATLGASVVESLFGSPRPRAASTGAGI
jgi:flavin-dependent dehydrogenase